MARFCHFWRMTPAEYKQLKVVEWEAMTGYMADVIREQAKAAT